MAAPATSMCALEDTLGKLLLPSNDAIKEGTHQLQHHSKDPLFVAELVKVISGSQNPQVRQLAAVLLRRRIAKKWKTLKTEDQQQMKHLLLELIVKEPERIVQNSVGQIIATISKHEIPKSTWPELLQFLNNTLHSSVCLEREISSHVLSCVASSSAESLQPMFRDLFRLISNMLRDPESKFVPLNGIRTLTSLVVCIGTDEVNLFRQLIPPVIELMPQLLAWNEDYGCDAMELFDELLESEVSILAPYLKPLVQLSCEIASNSSFGDNARVKALSNLSSLMRLRKKAVIKNKLVAPLLKVIFPIMCENSDEEEDDDEDDEIETQKPSLVAAQVVDVMALNFPPDKLLPHVLKFIQPALQSQNPSERKAGLLSLAVLAEGCADYIKQKHLKNFLMSICQNISHESTTVRHAALFALGQFSFHMQPDISKFHSELVPLLLNYLNQAVQNPQESKRKGLSRIYYALEMFCENLGKDLLPYLPALMKQLLETLQTASKLHHKELAVSAIGAVAVAVEEEFLPYFESTMAQMQTYLVSSPTPDHMTLQSQAIDTLGVLARSVGQQHFYPLAGDCVDYGLRLLNEADDPDLRRCIYGLFASLSTILKEELTPHLPTLLKFIYSSLQSVEGVVAHYSEDSDQMAYLLDDMDGEEEDLQSADDSKDEDDDDDDVEGYSIENAYLDEKEDACSALGEIAVNIGLGFAQFYEISTTEVLKLHHFSAASIRKASVITTGQLQCMMGKVVLSGEISVSKDEFVKNASDVLMRLVEMIKEDEEKQVVMATLETFNDVLKMVGPLFASQDALLSSLMEAVKSVFQQKTACQGEDEDNDGGVDEDEEEQAEQDAMLIEYAGDLIPSMARTMGGEKFAPYLAGMLQLIFAKTKKASPVSDKSFATGVLSETVVAMETHIQAFTPHLLPVLMRLAGDEDDEVCNNSIFGLGVLVQYGGEQMHQHYPPLLQILSAILSQNRGEQVVDNVCAAVCRMVAANRELVPIDQVLPALLNKLPLKKDVEESDTVYPCLAQLVQLGQQDALQNLPRILALFTQVLKYQTISEETRAALVGTLRAACSTNEQHLSACIALLTPDLQEYLAGILNGTETG